MEDVNIGQRMWEMGCCGLGWRWWRVLGCTVGWWNVRWARASLVAQWVIHLQCRKASASVRSTGEGIGYPLQYSGLENCVDCIVHGVPKSQT